MLYRPLVNPSLRFPQQMPYRPQGKTVIGRNSITSSVSMSAVLSLWEEQPRRSRPPHRPGPPPGARRCPTPGKRVSCRWDDRTPPIPRALPGEGFRWRRSQASTVCPSLPPSPGLLLPRRGPPPWPPDATRHPSRPPTRIPCARRRVRRTWRTRYNRFPSISEQSSVDFSVWGSAPLRPVA
jgi:hypothetical protein